MHATPNKTTRWLDVGCLLFNLGLVLYLGADLNWDLLNYHLYAPHLLLSRSLDQDFMAASMQGYLNAVPYIPLYALVRVGASSICVALVLAALQSVSLMLAHRIADVLLPPDAKHRLWLRILAAALAGCSAIYWVEIGSSLADVLVAIPVMAAVWLWLRGIVHAGTDAGAGSTVATTAWIAGWLGLAIGLKPTAVVWVAPLLGYQVLRGSPIRTAFVAGASLLLGFLLVDGWWAWRLWKEYGNPLFPLVNGLFHSPDAVEGALQHRRFIPNTLVDALMRPWDMLSSKPGAYLERPARDVRPFVFFMALGAWLCIALLPRRKQDARDTAPRPHLQAAYWLVLALVFEWIVWLYLSSNGRYAAPLLLLLGPGLVAAGWLIARDSRWLSYGLAAVLALQLGSNLRGGVERWDTAPFQAHYTQVQLPQEWRKTPSLYLSLQNQSLAFLSLQVHPDSGFVNLLGQLPLDPDGRGWSRVDKLLARHGGAFRTLHLITAEAAGDDPASAMRHSIEVQQTFLLPYGLALDDKQCSYFKLWQDESSATGGDSLSNMGAWIMSCQGHRMDAARMQLREAFLPALASANKVFESIEQRCGAISRGMTASIRYFGEVYAKQYVNTDITLMIQGDTGGMHAFNFHGKVGMQGECADADAMYAMMQQHKLWRASQAYTKLLPAR